jgi:hypothetical protein
MVKMNSDAGRKTPANPCNNVGVNWARAPLGAQWWSMGPRGDAVWYIAPENSKSLAFLDAVALPAPSFGYHGDWRESLVERPF